MFEILIYEIFFVQFVVSVETEIDEGLYNLYFHNCPNYKDGPSVALNFMVSVIWLL
jgi:hypothetical protein